MSNIPTVLLVEDHRLIMAGLRSSLELLKCCQIVGAVGDGLAAVSETRRLRPDVVLMDVGLPGIDGVEATWRIKQIEPRTRVIMFTSYTEPDDVSAALGAGADGYCSKNTPIELIAAAISSVIGGEVWLDPKIADVIVAIGIADKSNGADLSQTEMQILSLIKDRLTNREIATRLQLTPENIARIMQEIIQRFMAKAEAEKTEAEKTTQKNQKIEQIEQIEHTTPNKWLETFVTSALSISRTSRGKRDGAG